MTLTTFTIGTTNCPEMVRSLEQSPLHGSSCQPVKWNMCSLAWWRIQAQLATASPPTVVANMAIRSAFPSDCGCGVCENAPQSSPPLTPAAFHPKTLQLKQSSECRTSCKRVSGPLLKAGVVWKQGLGLLIVDELEGLSLP